MMGSDSKKVVTSGMDLDGWKVMGEKRWHQVSIALKKK